MKVSYDMMDSEIQDLRKFYKRLYNTDHVPFCIKREDGVLLLMNNDFKTYSFWSYGDQHRDHLMPDMMKDRKYSYRDLMREQSDPSVWIIESWAPIDNLFNNPEKYFQEESQIKVNYRRNVRNTRKSTEEL